MRGLLAAVYGWFTEGFDTADLAHSDEAGRGFRCDAGPDSDLKPAAVPI
jgi:hypothetical protein